jgi:hypothetical protein
MRLICMAAGLAALAAACAPAPPPVSRCYVEGDSLIGRNVAALSFPADANVRVVCTTCPTTRDYRPDRLNVRFNQETGIVEQVDCG